MAEALPRGDSTGGYSHLLRSLRHRNYRLFFSGQSISLVGTWMQRIALSWLVWRLTGSAMLLGVVGFAGQIPAFVLAPLAGVLADRVNLRRFVVLMQVLALVQAALLAILTLTGAITPWQIVALSVFMGLINAFDMPARHAFLVQMVEKPADLGNAVALNSFLVNGARLVGPSLAGLLIVAVGEGVCFLLNAVSYGAVIAALLTMRVRPQSQPASDGPLLRRLREGFVYAFGFAPIRAVLLLLALSSVMGMCYVTLMPIFVEGVLGGGPHELGFLLGAVGLGALVGAVYLASRQSVIGLGGVIAVGGGVFGLALVAFSFSRRFELSLALMGLTGLGMMLQMASTNTLLQTIVDDDKRGRVMSFYTMAFFGMTPFGSLLAGAMADAFGAPRALLLGGGCIVLGTLVFACRLPALRRLARPVYLEKGLIATTVEPEE